MARLVAFGTDAGAIPRGGDLGYAVHLALRRSLGEAGPQPFRLFEQSGDLFAYTKIVDRVLEAAYLPAAEPNIAVARSAIGIDTIEIKPMPEVWREGARYQFEVRVRPVRRRGKDKRSAGFPGEHDVFGTAVRGLPQGEWPIQDRVYLDWTRGKLTESGIVEIESDLRVGSRKRTEVVRRGHNDTGLRHRIDGPDIVVKGSLRIATAGAFSEFLARGIGRHRAFGFGMMLLKPVARR
jgi:CRISPR system Cascade subunit CasE